ncbi:MAG: hypothetical protein ACYTEX_11220 [Planctomycetota bacterium]
MAEKSQAMTKSKGQALQRIETVEALSVHFDSAKHIVLAPKTVLSGGLPDGMTLSIREVKCDLSDTYYMPKKDGKAMKGLPKSLLMQISDAVGLAWEKPTRTDDRKHPHYCEWTASAVKTDLDGSRTPYHDTKCIDLREDAGGKIMGKDYEEMIESAKEANKRAKAKAERENYNYKERDPMDQIRQARKFISEICLAKAMNRVVADATGIKRSYPEKELKDKTFIIAKLVPDTRDPDAKRAVLAEAMGATDALFGKPEQAGTVVDAEFEEPSGGEATEESVENVEEGSPSPSADSEVQPEVGTPEVINAVKATWARAREGGMEGKTFAKLCVDSTGKNKKEEMSKDDVAKMGKALDEWLKQKQVDEDEEVPF